MPTLSPDSLIGRRIDLLGRVQGVLLGSANFGTATTIFRTGDSDYPLKSTFIAYLVLDLLTVTNTPNGAIYVPTSGTLSVGVKFDIGTPATNDWAGATLDFGNEPAPAVAYCGQMLAGSFVLPLYAQAVAFTATNASTGASSQIGQFSAYGFGYG